MVERKVCFLLEAGNLGDFQVVLFLKNLLENAGDIRHRFDPWVGKIP